MYEEWEILLGTFLAGELIQLGWLTAQTDTDNRETDTGHRQGGPSFFEVLFRQGNKNNNETR